MSTKFLPRAGRHATLACALSLLCFAFTQSAAAEGWWEKAKSLLGEEDAAESSGSSLSEDTISSGLKEALRVGTGRVVGQLGQTDGFNADPAIHIPLPGSLVQVQSAMETIGMAGTLDDLELRLNRAAEIATPKAKALFVQAISEMTLDDVMGIYQGPDDAATTYFRGKMEQPLAEHMLPVVDESLADAGAVKLYDDTMARYNALPFVPPVEADLRGYVVSKGMDGIFHYLAREEAAIRENPAQRTTALLKQVFGN